MRLVVKEFLVNDDTIVIRYCISAPSGPPPANDGGPNNDTDNAAAPSMLLPQGASMSRRCSKTPGPSVHSIVCRYSSGAKPDATKSWSLPASSMVVMAP